jgi:glucose-6-phosphate 1-dehydrogenase
VPFYLRTGKRLPSASPKSSSSSARFRIRSSISRPAASKPNQLVIRLQPDEGVKLWMMIKDPGPGGMRLREVPLDMSFAETFGERNPDAYERLLMDVVRGNQTLFMRRDEVEAAWKWVDPILERLGCGIAEAQKLHGRHLGTVGAIALIERDGRTWHESAMAMPL